MVTNYYVENGFRDVGGIDRSCNWFVEHYLCESIDDDEKQDMTAAFLIGGNRHLVQIASRWLKRHTDR